MATAARLAEIVALEGLGRRFFLAFEKRLDAMAESLTGCRAGDRRDLALLQLNRMLFLYFVQSKGWLNGKPDFLRTQVDACLERKRSVDKHLLRPLFFGTLNRAVADRTACVRAFGRIPFLNGGLFEPHPLERKWNGTIPNGTWRETFDTLFERFQFTAAEGTGCAIAPDMLGRVFEGVMAPEERRRSGTFYTPPDLVRGLLEECLAVFLTRRTGAPPARAPALLDQPDDHVVSLLRGITVLDPAAGSGAFLLAALERLADLTRSPGESIAAARRRTLVSNLFGVDVNPTAVRLTELRLWLSVIADDPSESPERVAPLPNLDCLIRQGDSLTDPLGLIARMPFRPEAMGGALAGLRRAFSEATGRRKSAAARHLRAAEVAAMRACLVLA
jgi:type I restriction-modification system DNA methylase subunit